MTRPAYQSVDAYVAAVLPYDGPHSAEQITAALAVMAGLARHLANATRQPAALPVPTDLDRAVGQLSEALRSLPQLATHLDGIAQHFTGDDRMLSDSLPGTANPDELAIDASLALEAAAVDLASAARHLSTAHSRTSHLYWEDGTGGD